MKVENQAEFRQAQESQLTALIRVIQVLIGLSFVIALIGIINTLSLSVFERIHEIGLLRSVGMTRRQLRRSIYWEALIVAVFGGLLGVAVGTVFGVATALALPESFVQTVAVPWLDLVVFVVISAVAGAAGRHPPRGAGRTHEHPRRHSPRVGARRSPNGILDVVVLDIQAQLRQVQFVEGLGFRSSGRRGRRSARRCSPCARARGRGGWAATATGP